MPSSLISPQAWARTGSARPIGPVASDAMEPIDGEPVLDLPCRAELEAWLEDQPSASRAVWVRAATNSRLPSGIAEVEAAKADGRWDNPWT